ncbi:MAG TPA: FAD:protein FMN transferase [Verrucomicrobiae bacterium]|nr:FAD:protein FMN transferase [Verrucomicrobiae bacterium]
MTSPRSAQEAVARVVQSAQTSVEKGLYKLEFYAMSTVCRVNCHGVSAKVAADFQRDVVAWTGQFEARYSRFIPDSLIGRINAAAGEHWVETDAETDRLFQLCHELYFFTHRAFDPTALPLMKLWNWKVRPPIIPDDAQIRAALELVGWNKVQRRAGGLFLPQRNMAIDLGGIGKEYAVDCVMNMAVQRGISNVLVDFGRDVRVRGHAPDKKFWWIGLEDAHNEGKCWTGVAVTDHAVATSSDTSRYFEINGRRYSHIIDPRTGYPADSSCRGVTVIAPSCTIAGLFSTSVFVVGPKDGLQMIETHPSAAGAVTTHSTRFYSKRFYEYIPA